MEQVEQDLLRLVENRLDLDRILSIARSAPPVETVAETDPVLPDAHGLRIGYLRDSAFSFYYPENLEELERAGAELVSVSSLKAGVLPEDLHALYIGGGFPETCAQKLSANRSFLESLRQACANGLPVYAECGGLMLLARSLTWKGTRYPMANVFGLDVEVFKTPQGHGYSELRVDTPNPFLPLGALLRGHEFHYSRIVSDADTIGTACAVVRGTGCLPGRDWLVMGKVMAGYTHLHAAATPEWTRGMVLAAREFALAISSPRL
jgi:cobyrinic acid a,c-diamide synthase